MGENKTSGMEVMEGEMTIAEVRERGRRKEKGNEEQIQGVRGLHNTCM